MRGATRGTGSGLLKLNDGDRDPGNGECRFPCGPFHHGWRRRLRLDDLVSFAHVFETTLDCVRSNRLEPIRTSESHAEIADVLADLTTPPVTGGVTSAQPAN